MQLKGLSERERELGMNEVSGMNEAERTFYVCCISAEMWVIPTFFKIHQLPLQFWPFFQRGARQIFAFFPSKLVKSFSTLYQQILNLFGG